MKNLKNQSGQALLIIVLVMAVALTVGLVVVSRSITNIRIARQEEESARVFSVAEAGIEEALKLGSGTSGTIGEIGYSVSETAQGGGTEFVFPTQIAQGDTQTVWLVEHNQDGSLNPAVTYKSNKIEIYWGNEGTPVDQETTPALEVSLFYRQGSDYKLTHFAFDPNSARRSTNKFENVPQTGGYGLAGKRLQVFKEVDLPSGITPYALRLKLLYNNDRAHLLGVKVVGDTTLPSQGKCFESTASLPTSGITRKVQQCQFHQAPSATFDYLLYSSGDLSK